MPRGSASFLLLVLTPFYATIGFIQVIGPYMYPDDNEGIVCIAIFKYDKAKAGEAAEAIANGLMLYSTIPGFRYSLRAASGAATTMKMMGFE